MSDNPALAHLDASIRNLRRSVANSVYPTSDPATPEEIAIQKKRIVINYDPLFEIAELPVVALEQFNLSVNLFHRNAGYEPPEKDMIEFTFTQRKEPVYMDLGFTLVVMCDKARDLMPLHEKVIQWAEKTKYLEVANDGEDEAYEYGVWLEDATGLSAFSRDVGHLNTFTLRGRIEAVRIYPDVQLSGKLVRYRIFKVYTVDGSTQLEEWNPDGAP